MTKRPGAETELLHGGAERSAAPRRSLWRKGGCGIPLLNIVVLLSRWIKLPLRGGLRGAESVPFLPTIVHFCVLRGALAASLGGPLRVEGEIPCIYRSAGGASWLLRRRRRCR